MFRTLNKEIPLVITLVALLMIISVESGILISLSLAQRTNIFKKTSNSNQSRVSLRDLKNANNNAAIYYLTHDLIPTLSAPIKNNDQKEVVNLYYYGYVGDTKETKHFWIIKIIDSNGREVITLHNRLTNLNNKIKADIKRDKFFSIKNTKLKPISYKDIRVGDKIKVIVHIELTSKRTDLINKSYKEYYIIK